MKAHPITNFIHILYVFQLICQMKQKNYLMKDWLKLEGRGLFLGPVTLHCPRTPKYISIWDQVGAKKSLQVGEVGPQTFWAWVK